LSFFPLLLQDFFVQPRTAAKQLPHGNLEVAAAARIYWLACGGTWKGDGDPLNGWYDYFKAVSDHSGEVVHTISAAHSDRRGSGAEARTKNKTVNGDVNGEDLQTDQER
jgi:hypothetical protein